MLYTVFYNATHFCGAFETKELASQQIQELSQTRDGDFCILVYYVNRGVFEKIPVCNVENATFRPASAASGKGCSLTNAKQEPPPAPASTKPVPPELVSLFPDVKFKEIIPGIQYTDEKGNVYGSVDKQWKQFPPYKVEIAPHTSG